MIDLCVICVKRHFDKKIKITKNVLHMVVIFLPMVLMLVDWLASKLNLNFGGGRRSRRQWSIQDMTGSALPLSFLYVSKNQGVQKAQPKTIILKNLRNPKWGKWILKEQVENLMTLTGSFYLMAVRKSG